MKVYVCNIMTQPGETENYTVSDHIRTIHNHAKRQIIDICLVNSGEVDKSILRRYEADRAQKVKVDTRRLKDGN